MEFLSRQESEWEFAIPFSKGFLQPVDQNQVSALQDSTVWVTGKSYLILVTHKVFMTVGKVVGPAVSASKIFSSSCKQVLFSKVQGLLVGETGQHIQQFWSWLYVTISMEMTLEVMRNTGRGPGAQGSFLVAQEPGSKRYSFLQEKFTESLMSCIGEEEEREAHECRKRATQTLQTMEEVWTLWEEMGVF